MNHHRPADARILDAIGAAGLSPNGVSRLFTALQRDGQQRVLPTMANALAILALDPALAGLLCYDEFRDQFVIDRPPPPALECHPPVPGPYPRALEPNDVGLLHAYLQRAWSHRFSRRTLEEAVPVTGWRNRFHPVRDWLATLPWDGEPRLGIWLRRAFGCPADPYHSAAGAKMLVAAVRRIRRPGAKCDHVPVLEGPQGIGKSSALRLLFGDEWFSDALPPDLASKDAALGLCGVWCLELAELQQLIRSEPATVKAYLTRQVDRFRPPYGKVFVDRPRQTVLIGTTNDDEWLSDPTGNRRFWPLACEHADLDWIAGNREQLWAEAAAREAAGESHWLDCDEARHGAADAQAGRLIEDPWSDKVRGLLVDGRVRVTATEVFERLGIPATHQTKAAQMRVAGIFRAAGWRKDRESRSRFWVREEARDDGGDGW